MLITGLCTLHSIVSAEMWHGMDAAAGTMLSTYHSFSQTMIAQTAMFQCSQVRDHHQGTRRHHNLSSSTTARCLTKPQKKFHPPYLIASIYFTSAGVTTATHLLCPCRHAAGLWSHQGNVWGQWCGQGLRGHQQLWCLSHHGAGGWGGRGGRLWWCAPVEGHWNDCKKN